VLADGLCVGVAVGVPARLRQRPGATSTMQEAR
jgi:hypothetical protein